MMGSSVTMTPRDISDRICDITVQCTTTVVTSIIKQGLEQGRKQISRVASLPVFLAVGYWTRWNSVIIPLPLFYNAN
jgi:hypothetical protein